MSDKPQASQNRGLLKLLLTVMVVLVGLSLYLGRDDGSEHPLLPDLPDAEIVQIPAATVTSTITRPGLPPGTEP
ncbi:MAG: hypothetical protein ACKVHO_00655 [Verrucomicrobiia bacterium]